MNEHKQKELARSIFIDMLDILVSPKKIDALSTAESFAISMSAVCNALGAFLAMSLDSSSFEKAIKEICENVKLSATSYDTVCQAIEKTIP